MPPTLWWRSTCCPPGGALPPLRADCVDDYEELPVSVPPHVPQGLSRDAAPPSAGGGGGERAHAEEEKQVLDGGAGAGSSWLVLVCAAVYGKVSGPFRS
ncbi:hypothetical protein ACP70R_031342 [Stipagrostis hirtigluma subsp. patula]